MLFRRSISLVLSLVVFSSLTAPAFADNVGTVISVANEITSLGDWLLDIGCMVGSAFVSVFDENRCSAAGSDPNYRHNFIKQHTQVDGKIGYYYICERCGKSAGEVLDEAQAEYVATLPASTVTSDGGFYWYPTVDDLSKASLDYYPFVPSVLPRNILDKSDNWTGTPYITDSSITYTKFILLDNRRTWSYAIYYPNGSATSCYVGFEELSFNKPCDGYYKLLKESLAFASDFNYNWASKDLGLIVDDKKIVVPSRYKTVSIGSFNGLFHLPSFKVKPYVPYNVTTSDISETYNTGTRAASITGNYGIITESGDVQKIDTQTIVNEGDSTYYNPTTNETTTFTDWTYDYSDRSYTLTLESGDTTTITYGDEYVTINEGDTVTNVYYIVESSSGDDSGGGTDTPAHTHSYTSSVTREPTCIG